MLRYHQRPDDAATVDGEDGGDDGEARLQHQMVMRRTVAVKTMKLGAPPLFHDVTTQDGNEAGKLDFFL